MKAYYNEHDRKTAAWLRELIKRGVIADGEVDERSIVDVQPGDLAGYTQCHFFAGIGGWSYALRLAGWPDDRPVWTGSCPCQPFSMAGEGKGTDDPRHLWPAWFRLWSECRPPVVFGEQTASLDGLYWLDLVYADVEAQDYALGASDLSGACLGSPDIRPRLWFVADTDTSGWGARVADADAGCWQSDIARRGEAGWVGDSNGERRERQSVHIQQRGPQSAVSEAARRGAAGGLADGYRARLEERGVIRRLEPGAVGAPTRQDAERDSLLGGFWSDCEWIYCRPEPRYPEGCYRPIEPGSFPLVAGVPARILRLRGYGNAIKPEVAAVLIRAYLEARQEAPA